MSDIKNDFDLKTLHYSFIENLKAQGKSSSTILAYGKDIDQLVVFLSKEGIANITDIKEDHLKKFFDKMISDQYTAKSVSRKINSVKTFYRFAEKNYGIKINPTGNLKYPKYENKPPRVLAPLEYRALRDAAREDTRIYAIVELFLQTGMRISEIANLRLEDANENDLFIRPIERNKERLIPLNKAAKQALDQYLKGRPRTIANNIFVTKTGRPFLVRNIRTAIDRYFKIAGIKDAKVNDLRHTWIAHHLKNGTSLLLVNKIAGHKRLSTTERYLDLVKTQTEEKTKLEEL